MGSIARNRSTAPPLITNAVFGRSLDADQRNKRYLISMGVRLACFVGGVFTPAPWTLLFFAGAAIIPPIAVMLANATDNRSTPQRPDPYGTARTSLPSGRTLPGSVEE